MGKDTAFDEAIALAKANLGSSEDWVEAGDVIAFIQEMQAFLQHPEAFGKKKSSGKGKVSVKEKSSGKGKDPDKAEKKAEKKDDDND